MKLNHLTDKTLLLEMISLVQRERALLAQILWHLKEIDRRKLYVEVKCGSLFEYCVKILMYSEAQASRRVTACRLLKEMPEIAEDIQKGELNLTQLNQVKIFFNDENIHDPEEKKKIIEKIKGKTTKKTEEILWEMKKEDTPRKITVVLKEDTVSTLRKVQALRGHKFPDMDSLLMEMARECSRLWDPTLIKRKSKVIEGSGRYVPVQVKAKVWERDEGKCKNCGSDFALEIDHVKPYAVGGKGQVENLRLLCRNCNQRKGQIFFNKGLPLPFK